MKDYNQNVIVVCSDYVEPGRKRSSQLGGGLYICNTLDHSFIKKASGAFRQITKVEQVYYVVEFIEKKVHVFSKNFELLEILDIDQSGKNEEKPNACGIAYHPQKKLIFVANAGSDTINIYEQKGFKLVEKIHFSEKFNKIGQAQHHINDICIVEDSLYVSYFSATGNWRKNILDGGITEFDIHNFSLSREVVRNLWMPHSVQFLDGNLCYLNSMHGELFIGNTKVAGKFPGFVRGLDFDGRFFYVGQSEDLYMSRLFGVSQNIMMNAGFYLFDEHNKASRFYSFPHIVNIHDLLVLKNE